MVLKIELYQLHDLLLSVFIDLLNLLRDIVDVAVIHDVEDLLLVLAFEFLLDLEDDGGLDLFGDVFELVTNNHLLV